MMIGILKFPSKRLQKIGNDFEHLSYRRLLNHKSKVICVAWNSSGNLLGSSSSDGSIRIWDVANMHMLSAHVFQGSIALKAHQEEVDQISWHPTDPNIFGSVSDKYLKIWDGREKFHSPAKIFELNEPLLSLSWYPDGSMIVVSNEKDDLFFYDFRMPDNPIAESGQNASKAIESSKLSSKAFKTFYFDHQINELKWSPEGDQLYVTSAFGFVEVYEWPTLKLVKQLYGHVDNVFCIAVNPVKELMAFGGFDGIVSVWNRANLVCLTTYEGCQWPIRNLSYSHDGEYLACASEDTHISILNGDYELAFRLHVSTPTLSVAWHPYEHILAYARDVEPKHDCSISLFGIGASAKKDNLGSVASVNKLFDLSKSLDLTLDQMVQPVLGISSGGGAVGMAGGVSHRGSVVHVPGGTGNGMGNLSGGTGSGLLSAGGSGFIGGSNAGTVGLGPGAGVGPPGVTGVGSTGVTPSGGGVGGRTAGGYLGGAHGGASQYQMNRSQGTTHGTAWMRY